MAREFSPDSPAALAAAALFLRDVIEIWILFGLGIIITVLRTYARVSAVGFKELQLDDYLAWLGITLEQKLVYAAHSAVGFCLGAYARGFSNHGMTADQRAALWPNSHEYRFRVLGSKIQLVSWILYSFFILILKLSMLCFYMRLTKGLGRPYRIRINIGFALVIGAFIAILICIFASCQPFYQYWQISPNPGSVCFPGYSLPIILTSYVTNVTTDLYLLWIPLPMLWKSTLRLYKKIAATLVLGGGVFVIVCVTLKTAFILDDPIRGSQLATFWGIREPFAAVVVTNIPMIFPLIKSWLSPCLRIGTRLKTSKKSPPFPVQSQLTSSVGGRNGHSRRQRHPFDPDDESNMFDDDDATITESEDSLGHVVGPHGALTLVRLPPHAKPNHGITVHQEVEVITEGETVRDHALRRFPIDTYWGSSVVVSTASAAGPRSIRFVRR